MAVSLERTEATFAFEGEVPEGELAAVNDARENAGKPAMRLDPRAQRAAQRHAENMARLARMAHKLPGGPGFRARMRRNGIDGLAAENVAWGQPDIVRAVASWMKSPPHRRNLLNRRFGGVGVASAEAKDGRRYWAMVLVP